MRLNFSGVPEEAIREGIRRIGEVVREQVALYGTLTGAAPAEAPAAEPVADPAMADVLHLRPPGTRERRSDAR
jgi:2-aminoadipate transaminase